MCPYLSVWDRGDRQSYPVLSKEHALLLSCLAGGERWTPRPHWPSHARFLKSLSVIHPGKRACVYPPLSVSLGLSEEVWQAEWLKSSEKHSLQHLEAGNLGLKSQEPHAEIWMENPVWTVRSFGLLLGRFCKPAWLQVHIFNLLFNFYVAFSLSLYGIS